MLYWVLATGLGATLFSARGYIGADSERRLVRTYSWILLAITLAATAVSMCFIGNRVLSSFVPFIAVFTALGLMKARLRHAAIKA
jgi:hypothetical protein